MPTYTKFKAVDHIGQVSLSDQIEANMVGFLQWALLCAGAFFNVRIPTSGAYGGNQHVLRLCNDPNYTTGRVWEGFRSDWVWESGIEYHTQPIQFSGVYVNGAFYPKTTAGAYSHYVNYPLGRIVFSGALPTTSVVTCEYSYRYYNVTTADVPWFRELMPNSFRVDDSHFRQTTSGAWSIPANMRVQLPAVIVQATPRGRTFSHVPYEIGGGTLTQRDVLFNIVGETSTDVKQVADAIDAQYEHMIYGFNKHLMVMWTGFPLNANGSLVNGALMYPDLVNPTGPYAWRKIRFANTTVQEQSSRLPFFMAVVRATLEIHTPEI